MVVAGKKLTVGTGNFMHLLGIKQAFAKYSPYIPDAQKYSHPSQDKTQRNQDGLEALDQTMGDNIEEL